MNNNLDWPDKDVLGNVYDEVPDEIEDDFEGYCSVEDDLPAVSIGEILNNNSAKEQEERYKINELHKDAKYLGKRICFDLVGTIFMGVATYLFAVEKILVTHSSSEKELSIMISLAVAGYEALNLLCGTAALKSTHDKLKKLNKQV